MNFVEEKLLRMLIMGAYSPVINPGSPEDTTGYWQDVDYYCTSWRQCCLADNHIMASRRTILHQVRNDARQRLGQRQIPDSEIHLGVIGAGVAAPPLPSATETSTAPASAQAIAESWDEILGSGPLPVPMAPMPPLATPRNRPDSYSFLAPTPARRIGRVRL